MLLVTQKGREETLPWPPIAGVERLYKEDQKRPCGQHYKMLVFNVRLSGIVRVSMNACGESPLLHPLFLLFYGKGMGGVHLAVSDRIKDSGAAASFYATGGETYTAVFTSYFPEETGSFTFNIEVER